MHMSRLDESVSSLDKPEQPRPSWTMTKGRELICWRLSRMIKPIKRRRSGEGSRENLIRRIRKAIMQPQPTGIKLRNSTEDLAAEVMIMPSKIVPLHFPNQAEDTQSLTRRRLQHPKALMQTLAESHITICKDKWNPNITGPTLMGHHILPK